MADPNRRIQSNQLAEFFVENAGGGQITDATLNEDSLTISKTNTSANGHLLVLSNLGTGDDIQGTGGVFRVDKSGNIFGNTITISSFNTANLNVTSTLQTNFLDVNIDLGVQRNLSVNQNLNVQGDLSVVGTTNLSNGTFTNVTVTNLLRASNDLLVSGSLVVSGGTLRISPSSTLVVSGSTNFKNLTADAANITDGTITSLNVSSGVFSGANIASGVVNILCVQDRIKLDIPSSIDKFNVDAFVTSSGLSGDNPILFTVGTGSPFGLSFYNGINTLSLTAAALIEYDATVPDDFSTPGAAINANVTRLFIRNGTYDDTGLGSLATSQRTVIQGESRNGVIWEFSSLSITNDENKFSKLTIGNGSDNSSITITGNNNILEDLKINIDATTTLEKIAITGNDTVISHIEEVDTECYTLLRLVGNRFIVNDIQGGLNTTNRSSDYQFEFLGSFNVIQHLTAQSNNLIYLSGASNNFKNLTLTAGYDNDAITIVGSSDLLFDNLNLTIAATVADANAFWIDNSTGITINNVISDLGSAPTNEAKFIYLNDFPAGNIDFNISDIYLKYYENFLFINDPGATIESRGLTIRDIQCENQSGHFIENTAGTFTLSDVYLNSIKATFANTTSSLIQYYSGGGSGVICSNWKIVNCYSELAAGVTTTRHLDFDFTANTSTTTNGINYLEITNCTFINGGQALLYKGMGSHLNLTGINYESVGATIYAFEFDAEVGDIHHISMSSVNVENAGHFLKLTGSSSGNVRYSSLTGFTLNSSFSGGLTAGNGHFVMNAASSSTVDYIVASSGAINTGATSGTIFNSSGTGADGHIHAIMFNSSSASLNDSSWNVNDNNYGT